MWKVRWEERAPSSHCLIHDCRVRSEQPVASRSLLALWLPWVTHGSSMLHSLSHPPPISLFVSLLLIPSHSQLHSLPSSCLPLSFPPGLSFSSSSLARFFPPNFMSCFWIFLFLLSLFAFRHERTASTDTPPSLFLSFSFLHFAVESTFH